MYVGLIKKKDTREEHGQVNVQVSSVTKNSLSSANVLALALGCLDLECKQVTIVVKSKCWK